MSDDLNNSQHVVMYRILKEVQRGVWQLEDRTSNLGYWRVVEFILLVVIAIGVWR